MTLRMLKRWVVLGLDAKSKDQHAKMWPQVLEEVKADMIPSEADLEKEAPWTWEPPAVEAIAAGPSSSASDCAAAAGPLSGRPPYPTASPEAPPILPPESAPSKRRKM